MHALSVSLLRAKQLPVITNGLGASPHAGSTCTIGVVTVRLLNRLPARLYFKLKPDPNNTFFFIFTCTTQYPWVLANLNLSQAMAPSKKKRTYTVFRDSSAHRSASTSKPRFVGEKVRLGDVLKSSSTRNKDNRCANVYSVTNSKGFVPSEEYFSKEVFSKELRTYRIVARNMLAYNPSRINVGSVALQDKADEVVVSPLYVVFSTDTSKLMPEYLVHFLKSKPGLDQIAFQSIGTVRNNLKYKALCQMELRIPSLGEQQARLNTLREVQLQIEQAESQIAELDQLAKSRFVEMFGDPASDESRWERKALGETCRIITGNTPSRKDASNYGDHIEWCKTDNITDAKYLTPAAEMLSEGGAGKGRIAPVGSILMACIAGSIKSIGKVAVANRPVAFNQQINAVIPGDALITDYLLWAFKLSKDYLCSNVNMQLKGILNKSALSAKGFPVPPLSLQQEFADFVAQVDKSRFVRDHEMNFR